MTYTKKKYTPKTKEQIKETQEIMDKVLTDIKNYFESTEDIQIELALNSWRSL